MLGHEGFVVKPLPETLHGTPGMVGATILGEEQVVLSLELTGR